MAPGRGGAATQSSGASPADARAASHKQTTGAGPHRGADADEKASSPAHADGVALALLSLAPLRVLDERVDIARAVAAYLEKTFYDLTVVALHDWATYAEMRALARQSYGLALRENQLPMGSLDVGLDVLRIMQNIDVFVSRFSYNLNQQNFVERRPDRGSKNVRCINIRSIASSLRQHGLGVLNTTVNYTYQFLAHKFHVFAQFLYDDYIRSHLSKERRWFRKHRDECQSMYPYDRAEALVRDIRKLGVGDDGLSFLDHFRALVTEIGNALGYVRMVRSAGAEFCADAAAFVPDFDEAARLARDAAGMPPGDDPVSSPAADGAAAAEQQQQQNATATTDDGAPLRHHLSRPTRDAAANLASVIETLSKNFAEGRDYFKVLVNVFKQVLLADDHAHLDNFYVIVPSLCLSWVESSLVAKDRMVKQNRTKDAYYADDGFAVGVAYVLAILEQGSRFDSLHWFDRVKAKLLADEKELDARLEAKRAKALAREEQRRKRQEQLQAQQASSSAFSFLSGGSKKAEKDRQSKNAAAAAQAADDDDDDDDDDDSGARALQLTGRRLKATKRENELLYFSISGARVFFRSQ